MKYSEFKEYLRLNDISLKEDEEKLIADDQFEISKKKEQTIWFLAAYIDCPYEYEMLKKVIELAETPLSEREFTLKEIEELKGKYDTDLKDFEIIEEED